MIMEIKPVRGTSRQRVVYDTGVVMERQFVYLEPRQWENLKKLAALQGTGGSQVIGRLIELATNFKKPR